MTMRAPSAREERLAPGGLLGQERLGVGDRRPADASSASRTARRGPPGLACSQTTATPGAGQGRAAAGVVDDAGGRADDVRVRRRRARRGAGRPRARASRRRPRGRAARGRSRRSTASMSASESRHAQPSRSARRRPTVVLPAPIRPVTTTWSIGAPSPQGSRLHSGHGTSRRRSCRPPSSASSVAASSGGCSGRRRARWATGSRSSIPTRTARRRPSPTWSSSGRTTTSRPRCGWPRSSDVVTYELEHVAADGRRGARGAASRSGRGAGRSCVTQDRLAERRFVEAAGSPSRRGARSGRVAEARRAAADARPAAPAQAADRRLRRAGPAPDRDAAELDDAWERLGRRAGRAAPRRARARLRGGAVGDRRPRRSTARSRSSRSPGTSTTPGSSSRSVVAGAGHAGRRGARPSRSATSLALAMDLCGTLTVGALPAAATARSSSTSSRRASTTPATGRSRAPRRPSSSSTSGRSAGSGSGRRRRIGPAAMVNLLGTGPRRDGAAPRRGRRARRSGRPPPPLRQARGLRTPQDGAPHGARARRRRGARDGPRGALAALRWADDTTKDGGRPMTDADRGTARSSASSAAAAPTSRRSRRPSRVLDELGVRLGAQGRLGAPHARSAVPLRRGGRRSRASG